MLHGELDGKARGGGEARKWGKPELLAHGVRYHVPEAVRLCPRHVRREGPEQLHRAGVDAASEQEHRRLVR